MVQCRWGFDGVQSTLAKSPSRSQVASLLLQYEVTYLGTAIVRMVKSEKRMVWGGGGLSLTGNLLSLSHAPRCALRPLEHNM